MRVLRTAYRMLNHRGLVSQLANCRLHTSPAIELQRPSALAQQPQTVPTAQKASQQGNASHDRRSAVKSNAQVLDRLAQNESRAAALDVASLQNVDSSTVLPARIQNDAVESTGQSLHETIRDDVRLPTGMAVTWLGTSSGGPTKTRNVSCIALRTPEHTYIVDAGEGTCRQLACNGVAAQFISNIFITHLHGDHCFGLVGLLTFISNAREQRPQFQGELNVFGPPGLHEFMETQMRFSDINLAMPLRVTEFTVDLRGGKKAWSVRGIPNLTFAVQAPDNFEASLDAVRKAQEERYNLGEVIPGLIWSMPCENGLTVQSAQLKHRLACWGYVFQEASKAPTEKPDIVECVGLQPGQALAQLTKDSKPSDPIRCNSEQPITFRDILNAPTPGRRVVLLGDTCNSTAIEGIARGADLVSHEATFTKHMERKAWKSQHSTAAMAGEFARRIEASLLVLTHFSSRYSQISARAPPAKPSEEAQDASPQDISGVVNEARMAFGSPYVIPAQDFFTLDVYNKQQASQMRLALDKAIQSESRRPYPSDDRPRDPRSSGAFDRDSGSRPQYSSQNGRLNGRTNTRGRAQGQYASNRRSPEEYGQFRDKRMLNQGTNQPNKRQYPDSRPLNGRSHSGSDDGQLHREMNERGSDRVQRNVVYEDLDF